MKFVVAILICAFSGMSVYAQSDYRELLPGKWVFVGSQPARYIEDPVISTFIQYEFTNDGKVYLSRSEFERGIAADYVVRGNDVTAFDHSYVIDGYNDGRLTLRLKAIKTSVLMLIRKERFDSIWAVPQSPKMHSGTATPVFAGNFSLHDFLFSGYATPREYLDVTWHERIQQLRPYPPREDIIVKVKIAVDTCGEINVDRIVVEAAGSARKSKLYERKLQSTSGFWIPATDNGRAVAGSVELTIVRRGMTYYKFREKSAYHFERARQYHQKKKYEDAVKHADIAIELSPDNPGYRLFRAACYLRLEKVDEYCKDIIAAYSLNPFVSLTEVVDIQGETLEISCGTDR